MIYPNAPTAMVGTSILLTASLVDEAGKQKDVSSSARWYVVGKNGFTPVQRSFTCTAEGDVIVAAILAPFTKQTHILCQKNGAALPAPPIHKPIFPVLPIVAPVTTGPITSPVVSGPPATTPPVANPPIVGQPKVAPTAIAFAETPSVVRSEAPFKFTLIEPGSNGLSGFTANSWITDSSIAVVASDGTVHCNYSGPVALTATYGPLTTSTSFVCVVKSFNTPRGFSEHEERFDGPFLGWLNVQKFGAKGDGVTDDTSALQAALDAMAARANVIWMPRGTYRVTRPLIARDVKNSQMVGEDPASTTLAWTGGEHPDAAIVQCKGCLESVFKRFTIDGMHTQGALMSFDGGLSYSTNNALQDMRFVNADVGVRMFYAAELSIKRSEFRTLTKAGLSTENWDVHNVHIADSLFVDCGLGATNEFGMGTFHVSNSIFVRSTQADMSVGNAGVFSARNNLSFGSKTFFKSWPLRAASQISLQNNEIINPTDIPLDISNPGTAVLIDNVFVGVPADKPIFFSHGSYPAEILAIGNNYTSTKPYQGNIARLTSYAESPSETVASVSLPPDAVYTPPQSGRTIFEVPVLASSSTVQHVIEQAAANGSGVVHVPNGAINVSSGLTISSDADIALDGDGPYSGFIAAPGLKGPVLTITGKHVQMANMSVNGKGNDSILVLTPDAPGDNVFCDECSTSYPLFGLTMEQLDNSIVEARSSVLDCGLFNAQSFGSVAVGGPRLSAGKPGLAKLANLMTSIDNVWSYDGGHMVVSDAFRDSHEGQYHMLSTENGFITEEGYSLNTFGYPAITVIHADSDLTVIGDKLNTVVQADAASTSRLMLAGSLQSQGLDALNLLGSSATTMHLGSQTNINNGLSTKQADDVVSGQAVERAFSESRTTYDTPKWPYLQGSMRVRFDRVRSESGLRGLRVMPASDRADYEAFAIRGSHDNPSDAPSCSAVFNGEMNWTLVDGHDGSYGLHGSKGYLGESDLTVRDGAHALEFVDAMSSASQRWAILPYGDGSLTLVNRASGRFITSGQIDCFTAAETKDAQGQTWTFTK